MNANHQGEGQGTGSQGPSNPGDASPSKGGNDTKPSSDKPGPATGSGSTK